MKIYCLAVILVIILSCSNTKKMQEPGTAAKTESYIQGEFDKQGHRGCRGLRPENTVGAMVFAVGMGVTTLEMDVVISRDKKVLLSHEPWMGQEITTKPDGNYVTAAEEKSLNIYRMTYSEVKKYDVGMKPHPRFPQQEKREAYKPLLSEVIDSVKEYMTMARRPFPFYNIETKCTPAGDDIYHPKPAEFVELLMAVIKEKNVEDHVIIQSFDFRTLQYLHEKYPSIPTAALIEGNDKKGLEEQIRLLGFKPTIYSPGYQLVTEELIKKCHDMGIKIIPWTVNTKELIEKYKKMGVDGIISDYPDLFN